jgi:drug/metabolite transporter (DMT)-like permease
MKLVVVLLVTLHVLVASFTHVVARIALAGEKLPAEVVVTLRALVAAAALLASFLVYGRRRVGETRLGSRGIVLLLVLMALAVPLNQFFYLLALRHAPAVHGALLFSLTPLVVILFDVAAHGRYPPGTTWIGAILAILGVICVLDEKGLAFHVDQVKGDLLLLVSVLAWSGYTVIGRSLLSRFKTFEVTRLTLLGGTAMLLPITGAPTMSFDFSALSLRAMAAIVYLGLVTSIVAYVLWYALLRRIGATRVSVVATLQPVATGILGWVILDEAIGTKLLLGGLVVIAGVLLVQFADSRTRSAP